MQIFENVFLSKKIKKNKPSELPRKQVKFLFLIGKYFTKAGVLVSDLLKCPS